MFLKLFTLTCAGDRLLSLTVSAVCMELEDAMTIFSYSSPYPVQLSLLPATAATSPAPHGRRSWSLDQLAARRHGEVSFFNNSFITYSIRNFQSFKL